MYVANTNLNEDLLLRKKQCQNGCVWAKYRRVISPWMLHRSEMAFMDEVDTKYAWKRNTPLCEWEVRQFCQDCVNLQASLSLSCSYIQYVPNSGSL